MFISHVHSVLLSNCVDLHVSIPDYARPDRKRPLNVRHSHVRRTWPKMPSRRHRACFSCCKCKEYKVGNQMAIAPVVLISHCQRWTAEMQQTWCGFDLSRSVKEYFTFIWIWLSFHLLWLQTLIKNMCVLRWGNAYTSIISYPNPIRWELGGVCSTEVLWNCN